MRLCILSGKQFKDAFENTPKRVQVNQMNIQIKRLWTWQSILTYIFEMNSCCNQATNYLSKQNCNKLINKLHPSRMFSVSQLYIQPGTLAKNPHMADILCPLEVITKWRIIRENLKKSQIFDRIKNPLENENEKKIKKYPPKVKQCMCLC